MIGLLTWIMGSSTLFIPGLVLFFLVGGDKGVVC